MRTRNVVTAIAALAVLAGPVAAGSGGSQFALATPLSALQAATPQEEYQWLDPDGEPLPLSDAEVMDLLRSGEIIETVEIPIGINGIDRLLIEKDGMRIHGGFREVDLERKDHRVGNEFFLLFRDSYIFECAAYEIAKLLGLTNVPPTVVRKVDGVDGSLQVWVEGVYESINDAHPAKPLEWSRQLGTMKLFDALVYNIDRNPGNLLVDHEFRLWLIDHTRAFQVKAKPFELDKVINVRADVWDKLRALDEAQVAAAAGPFLTTRQISMLMERRDALVVHINALIAERPPGTVVY